MADDRDPDAPDPGQRDEPGPDPDPSPDPRPAAKDELDQTREFDPFADEGEPPAAQPGEAPPPKAGLGDTDPDRTAQLPAAGDETKLSPAAQDETRLAPAAGDETRQLPAGDETRLAPAAGDETRQLPAGDETRQLPAADETVPVPPQPAPWSGRAGVPPPDATTVRGPAPAEWAPPEEPGGRWWMPIVVGIVALLLLGALITGIVLIYNANKVEPTPTPTPSRTLAPTSAPATTAAPAPTSAPPPTTVPAGVPVPRLVGLTDEQARDELDRIGLSYRLVYRPAAEPPNTVIETEPGEGEVVPEGTEITLVIASPLTPTDPFTSAPTLEPTPTG